MTASADPSSPSSADDLERRLRPALLVLCLLGVCVAVWFAVERIIEHIPPSAERIIERIPPFAEEVEQIRRKLRWKDLIDETNCLRNFRERGTAKVFAAFEVILANPRSENEVITLFVALAWLEGDRSRLVGPTVQRLAHPNAEVRNSALFALEKIGTREEAPALVALLSDKDPYVATKAATLLVKVGGPNEVAAMDTWLQAPGNRNDAERHAHIQKCRDELHQCLAGARKR